MRRFILLVSALVGPAFVLACGSSGTGGSGGGGAGGSASSSSSSSTTSSSSTSSSSSSSSSTTSSSGSAGGACTNAADGTILNDPASMVESKVGDCGQQHIFDEPGRKTCIKDATGLSDGCTSCFSDTVTCAVQNCIGACGADPGGACCSICRATHCDAAFAACSGITPAAPPPPPDAGCN
jgi:type IV secretory pathway TrbL component